MGVVGKAVLKDNYGGQCLFHEQCSALTKSKGLYSCVLVPIYESCYALV